MVLVIMTMTTTTTTTTACGVMGEDLGAEFEEGVKVDAEMRKWKWKCEFLLSEGVKKTRNVRARMDG